MVERVLQRVCSRLLWRKQTMAGLCSLAMKVRRILQLLQQHYGRKYVWKFVVASVVGHLQVLSRVSAQSGQGSAETCQYLCSIER